MSILVTNTNTGLCEFLMMNPSGTTQPLASPREHITTLSIMNMMMIIIAIDYFYFLSICY